MKKFISSLGILLFTFSTALWAGGHDDGDGVKEHIDHVHDKAVDASKKADMEIDATQKEQADMDKKDMSPNSE